MAEIKNVAFRAASNGDILLRMDPNKDYGISKTGKSSSVAVCEFQMLDTIPGMEQYAGYMIQVRLIKPVRVRTAKEAPAVKTNKKAPAPVSTPVVAKKNKPAPVTTPVAKKKNKPAPVTTPVAKKRLTAADLLAARKIKR